MIQRAAASVMLVLAMAVGCSTEVVELSRHGAELADSRGAPQDGDLNMAASCFTTENATKRCLTCKTTTGSSTQCEDLVCAGLPGDAGPNCSKCYWSLHSEQVCVMCWDAAGLVKDNCHGANGDMGLFRQE